MTCQEQVELMQRYLDHDLNDTEEQELMLHLQHCEGCAGLFDRLKRLDDELSQLPKVIPAYSLVDAILPQLTELDWLPATFEETAAREPIAAVPSGGIPRTQRSFVSWKLAGGAAVAAALIGLFVMKEQNLFSSSLSMNSAASPASAGAKAAVDMKSTGSAPVSGGAAAKNNSADGAKNEGKDAVNGTMSVQDQASGNKASSPQKFEPDAKVVIPQQAPASPPKVPEHQADEDSNRVAISSSSADLSGAAAGRSAESPSSNTATGANTEGNASQPSGTEPSPEAETSGTEPGKSNAASPKVKAATPRMMTGPNAGIMSLGAPEPGSAPTPAPVTMKSPDSKLVAAVEQLKVVVRQSDTGATVRTSTYGWSAEDVITLISFSEDGKLTYQVQHPNGVDDVLLDVATGTETKNAVPAAAK